MGRNLEEVIRFFEIIQAQKASGATFTPLAVLDYLTSKVHASEKDHLKEMWYDSGKWYGTYLAEKFDDPLQALADFLKATRWDINEINLRKTENEVKVTCISTTMTEEGTESLSKFIEGAINNAGFRTEKNDHVKGMITLHFKREI